MDVRRPFKHACQNSSGTLEDWNLPEGHGGDYEWAVSESGPNMDELCTVPPMRWNREE